MADSLFDQWAKEKYIKKPPGVPAVSGRSGRLGQGRSELSTAGGVGEPKVAKVK
jgi:hypothetical protein